MSWTTPIFAVPGLMPVTTPKSDTSILQISPELMLETHVLGDNWPGITLVGPVTINGAAPDYPLAWASLTFSKGAYCAPAAIISTEGGNGSIIITDAATWQMEVPAISAEEFPLGLGIWEWHMKAMEGTTGKLYHLYSGWMQVIDSV